MSLLIRSSYVSHLNFFQHRNSKSSSFTDQIPSKLGFASSFHHASFVNLVYKRNLKMQSVSLSPMTVKSSLIDPDGGKLVELVIPESEIGRKKSESEWMPKVKLTKIDLEWVHVISEGWASPLKGFMREDEYLQSLHFNSLRLKDGTHVNMSLPIVLAIDDETKKEIEFSQNVALLSPQGDIIGTLRRYTSKWLHSKLAYRNKKLVDETLF